MAARDFYQELGVTRSASADEIRKAYKKLAAQLHPDRNPGDDAAEQRFKAVNRAYGVLSDATKRRLYDEFGEASLHEGFDEAAARAYARRGGFAGGVNLEDLFRSGGPSGGFGDIFGDFFGGRARRAPRKGSDVHSDVTIDFVSAIRGAELKLAIQDGAKDVKVRIPGGANNGDKVRVPGHGGPGTLGGPNGDLILEVHVRPHPCFEREDLDLYLDLPISPGESYRGAKVEVPTPSGNVTMKVPRHAQSGQVVRLKGKGVQRGPRQGDLFVRFLIRLPKAESPELDEAFDVLEDAITDDLRAAIRL